MLTRAVSPELADVGRAVAWADQIFVAGGVAAEVRADIQICVEEALANLILHGRMVGDDKGIVIAAGLGTGTPRVLISDRCQPFDAATAAIPGPPTLDEPRIGGNGLRLLRELASSLSYESQDGANHLAMTFEAAAAILRPRVGDLRAVQAFASTPDAVLAGLLAKSRVVRFEAGERIVGQSDPSTFALILLVGTVAVVNESHSRATSVARIPAPALIGEIGALAGLPRTATMVAEDAVSALRVERNALLDVARHTPEILVSVIGRMGQQIQNMNDALGLYAGGLAALERDEFDVAILDDLKNPSTELANFALAFGKLAGRISAERRSRGEMASAALIQRAMLPTALDDLTQDGRCDVFGDMKAARDVGGDFYDAFRLDDDRIAIAIGDVCGKGVPASLFMCVTMTTLRLAAREVRSLPAMIEHVNDLLCAQNATSMFSTLFYGVLDLSRGRLEYVSCGHSPPILIDPKGPPRELAAGGAPLGLLPGRRWSSNTVDLEKGQGVFLYTDGVTEAESATGDPYGEDRLLSLLHAHSDQGAAGLVRVCMQDVERFGAGMEPFDDVTCLTATIS